MIPDAMLVDMMLRDIDRKPCACGKRKESAPQVLIPQTVRVTRDVDIAGQINTTRCSACLICGVCREAHATSITVNEPCEQTCRR